MYRTSGDRTAGKAQDVELDGTGPHQYVAVLIQHLGLHRVAAAGQVGQRKGKAATAADLLAVLAIQVEPDDVARNQLWLERKAYGHVAVVCPNPFPGGWTQDGESGVSGRSFARWIGRAAALLVCATRTRRYRRQRDRLRRPHIDGPCIRARLIREKDLSVRTNSLVDLCSGGRRGEREHQN